MANISRERREQISVMLPSSLRLKLEKAAAEERRTLSNAAANILAQALEDHPGDKAAA